MARSLFGQGRRALKDFCNARVLAVAAPGLVMPVLGVWGLGRDSLFGSEADTYWAAQLPLSHLLRLLGHLDAVHGTYYLFMNMWLSLNTSLAWLRLPSVLGMAATAMLLSALTARLSGRSSNGLFAGLLFVFTPSTATWAQNGRSYALVVATVSALTLSLVHAVNTDATRPGARRRWVLFGALTVFAGYLHEFTLLLVVAFGVSLLWARVPRPVLRRWLVTSVAASVIVMPLVIFSASERSAVAHLRRPGLLALRQLFGQLFGSNIVVAVALLLLAVIGAWPPARARVTGRLSMGSLGVPLLLVPAGLLLVGSWLVRPLYDSRYVLYSTPAAAMLAAFGAVRVGRTVAAVVAAGPRSAGRLAAAWTALVCVVTAAGQWPVQQYLRTAASRGEDYGAAARYVARHREAAEALLFMSAGARNAQLGYPRAFFGLRDVASARSPEASGTFRGINKVPAQVIATLRSDDHVLVLGKYPVRNDPKGLRGVASVLSRDFVVAHVKNFPGVSVMVYDRRTRRAKP